MEHPKFKSTGGFHHSSLSPCSFVKNETGLGITLFEQSEQPVYFAFSLSANANENDMPKIGGNSADNNIG